MLRVLLHKALAAYGGLARSFCQGRWTAASSRRQQVPWTYNEMLAILNDICDSGAISVGILIDGLDECEERKHPQLLRDLKNLASRVHVKLCLSSQPWDTFTRAFSASPYLLHLQNLTLHDVYRTICDRLFGASPEMFPRNVCGDTLYEQLRTYSSYLEDLADEKAQAPLTAAEHEAQALVFHITSEAKGVYLWVSIVLDNVYERVQSGSSLRRLTHFIDQFPARLEDYSEQQIHQRISPAYREGSWSETAMVLQTATRLQQSNYSKLSVLPY